MPSERRTGLFGNHPILLAATAASGGVLLGAYVAVQLFASPVQQGPAASGPQPVAEAKADAKAAPETTGSAPPKDDVATVDRCEGQTWPYLSRDCTEQMQSNRRVTRVIAPDRLGKPAPDAPVAGSTASNAASSAPSAAPAPRAPNAAVASAPPAPPSSPPPAQQSDPPPAPAAQVAGPVPGATNPQDVASAGAVPNSAVSKAAEKRRLKEARRKAKKQKTNEFDDNALALAGRDGRDDDEQADQGDRIERRSVRVDGRPERSRRERVLVDRDDDDDDASAARGGRRVIVIRRGGGFGDIFGN